MRLTPCKLRDLSVSDWFMMDGFMFQVDKENYIEGYSDIFVCSRFEKNSFKIEDCEIYVTKLANVVKVELPDLPDSF